MLLSCSRSYGHTKIELGMTIVVILYKLHTFDFAVYNRVFNSRRTLGLLLLYNLIIIMQLIVCIVTMPTFDYVVSNPPIEFGSNHLYDTQSQPYFCQLPCYKNIVLDNTFLDQELLFGEIVYLFCVVFFVIYVVIK